MSRDIAKEITVSFVTRLPEEYHVPTDPIVVPTSMDSKNLSEMICSLLEIQGKNFQFLADGVLVRPNIEAYLETHDISTESILELEYVFSLENDENNDIDQHEDWISSIVVHNDEILSGSYDGNVRLYPKKSQTLVSRTGVQAIDVNIDGVVAVGTKDGYVHFYASSVSPYSYKTALVSVGASIESVRFNQDGSMVAVGAYNGKIYILNTPTQKATPAPTKESGEGAKKRSRVERQEEEDDEDDIALERVVLENHKKPVRGLRWTANDDLFSCSEDQTVRLWEIASASEVAIMPVSAPAIDMDVSADGKHVATAHDDGRLRVWELKGGEMPALILRRAYLAHKRMIRSVAFHPSNPSIVASLGLDGALRIFDIRAESLPVHVIYFPVENKWRGMACAWSADGNTLYTGGSDGILRAHSFKGLEHH